MSGYPALSNQGLTSIHEVDSINHLGASRAVSVAGELPLTVKVDGQNLVTLMTLGTHPEMLVLGYLRNQTLFDSPDQIKSIEVDWHCATAHVTTVSGTGLDGFDLGTRTITTGCGQGTVLSCTLDKLYDHRVSQVEIKQSDIYKVLKSISLCNQTYRITGSVHGCGLYQDGAVKLFIEDVGRHNAMDAIAGEMWLRQITGQDSFFYTTGRLTSEIVMKAALMGVAVLISRNGTTLMAQELAVELGVTLIARAKAEVFSRLTPITSCLTTFLSDLNQLASVNRPSRQEMYATPEGIEEAECVVKKSRFISRAGGVTNKAEAKSFVHQCRLDYADAGHHCWAYLLGDPERASSAAMSDDGEPSGTAGKPILNVLQHKGVGDIVVVVVRYFGGVKLGAGGLVRAYSASAQLVMDKLQTRMHQATNRLTVVVDFADETALRHWLVSVEGTMEKVVYGCEVTCMITIPKNVLPVFHNLAAAGNGV